MGAEPVMVPRPSGESLCLSEQSGCPQDGDQAGITEVSQSQWEETSSVENSSAHVTRKSRSELTSGEAFGALLIMKCFKWQRKRVSGATKPTLHARALVSMGPGFLRKCPQALPPVREWLPDSQAWEVWTRQKEGVGSLCGGGKDILEVPEPTELTTYALACSCPWQAWSGEGGKEGDQYLKISLGVGFCHSLQWVIVRAAAHLS